MSDQWFYRVFGEEFGPMPLEKLKELADFGTIQPLDDIRSSSGSWMPAVNVEELGLSTSQRRTSTAVATPASDFDVVTQTSNDAWYCAIGGTELGPVSFDEIIAFAENEQIGPDDRVKLGAGGKWRRAGSIGRLVSVFPYQAVEKKIESKPVNSIGSGLQAPAKRPTESLPDSARQPEPRPAPASAPTADIEATYRVAYEQAAAKVAESMVAQADAAYQAAEQQAMSSIAWASQAGVDRYWWGWSNGLEFGPVEFPQVFGLAKSGQLKPSDFVRNGQNGQYVPASSLPGVFAAVAFIVRAAEARDLAKSQAQAAAKQLTPPVSVPVSRINAEKAAAVVELPAPAPVAASRPVPAPRTAPVPQPAPVQPAPLDPDESILGEIRSTLSSRNVSGLNQLEFNVNQGVVTILGTANSEGERLLVNHLVQKIPGVERVVDSTSARPVTTPRPVSVARPAASGRTSNGPGFVAGLISNLQEIKPAHAVSVAASIGLLGLGYWYFGTNPARPVAVHPVKGKVIMNGEPLANASIVLHRVGKSKLPINLHPRAKASEDGTFALETFDRADGAPNGEFIATVFLSTVEEVNGEKLAGPNVLPVVYSRPETSPLKIQITSSTTELKPLELTQK